MNVAVAESQVAQALDVGIKAVQLRAVKDHWPVMRRPKQGGSERFFIRDLLPADVKQSLATAQAVTGLGLPSLVHDTPVPKRSKSVGLAKYNLVHAYRCAKEKAGWGKMGQAAEDFLLAYNAGLLLPQVLEVVGEIRPRTIEALDKKLQRNNDNYLCLCDGRGGWKKHGTNKYKERKLSEAAKAAFLKCYLHGSRPSIIMAIRAARITLERHGMPEAATDSTFRRWFIDYKQYNAGVICLAREGMKAYQDKFGAYISRDTTMLKVGQCLVADGKTLNFFIRHPETGRKCRMTLIVFFDWASRYPVGWQIMPTEDQLGILAAFRNAVETLGRYPDSVYLDNGRAFKSKLFTHTDPDFEDMTGLYARVGTAVMTAKPYNGRAKVVERFFQTFQEQFEFMMPSFCGDSIATRPAWLSRNETFHQKWHQARTGGWLPSIRDAAFFIKSYIQWYAQQPHAGLDGSPADLFLPNRGPGVDPVQLNHDFLWRIEVQPRNCRVTLWGIDYEADCLHNLDRGQKIRAMVDVADMNQAWCYTLDGAYLGEVHPVQALNPVARLFGDEVSMAQVKAANKRLSRLKKANKAQLENLGITKGMADSLSVMPFAAAEKVAITDTPAAAPVPQAPEQLPEKEVRRLEQLAASAQAEESAQPEIQKPPFWPSDLEHYTWCFEYVHKHRRALDPEDRAFMTEFESRAEFENYRQRYEDWKLIL